MGDQDPNSGASGGTPGSAAPNSSVVAMLGQQPEGSQKKPNGCLKVTQNCQGKQRMFHGGRKSCVKKSNKQL